MKKWNDMDKFEENLKRQPGRTIPGEWRKQILSAARSRERNIPDAKPAWRIAIEDIFSPTPKAWIGLACVWIVIATIHFTVVRSNESKIAAAESAPGMMAFGEQDKLLTETFGQISRPETPFQTPKKPVTPRSELLFLFKRA
jgi:hypothetical protein